MAKPKSEDRRQSILMAATALVAERGVGAATAEIAKKAGIPNGSLFTYFTTKTELLNVLYRELTMELTDTVVGAIATDCDLRSQFHSLWSAWTHWGAANPLKHRVQAQLHVSEQLTDLNRETTYEYGAPVYDLIQRASAGGALQDAPFRYVAGFISACASTTINFMINDSSDAERFCKFGFEGVWRALSSRDPQTGQ